MPGFQTEQDALDYTRENPDKVVAYDALHPILGQMGTIYFGHHDGEAHVVRTVSENLLEVSEAEPDDPRRRPHTVTQQGGALRDTRVLPKDETPFVEGVEEGEHVEL